MRVIICALGSSGDVYPCIEIGAILKERNHDVHILTNEYFKDYVESRNLSFSAVGSKGDFIRSVRDSQLWEKKTSLIKISAYMANYQVGMFHSIERLVNDNCVIIHSLWVFSAKVVSEKYSLKRFPISLTNANLKLCPGKFISWLESKLGTSLNLKAELFRRRLVSPLLQEVIASIRKAESLPDDKNIYTDLVDRRLKPIILYEPWFYEKKPQHGFYMGFLLNKNREFDHAPIINRFVDKKTVIFFTSWALSDEAGINHVLSSLKDEGLKCVLVTPTLDSIHVEENVIRTPYLNMDSIKGCLFAIHHGGIGTSAQLLKNGIPQLIYPKAFDQFENASSLERIGCGVKGGDINALRHMIKKSVTNDNNCAFYASRLSEENKERNDALERLLMG